MSLRSLQPLVGDVSRREMLGTLARWSVPTVLTMSLLSPTLLAAASCPPCTKRTGGRCRACTMNQILNCQCEPCLGAPYCAGAAAVMAPGAGASAAPQSRQLEGSSGMPLTAPGRGLEDPTLKLLRRGGAAGQNPFSFGRPSPYAAPLGSSNPYAADSGLRRSRGGLFDRLRPDTRRPF
jgi:hypothetical protein